METTVKVQWDIYVQSGRHICSGDYANSVKSMFTSVPGHMFDSSEFI